MEMMRGFLVVSVFSISSNSGPSRLEWGCYCGRWGVFGCLLEYGFFNFLVLTSFLLELLISLCFQCSSMSCLCN